MRGILVILCLLIATTGPATAAFGAVPPAGATEEDATHGVPPRPSPSTTAMGHDAAERDTTGVTPAMLALAGMALTAGLAFVTWTRPRG